MSEHCTCGTSDYCQVHDRIESLLARLVEAEALLRECRHFVKALCDHDDATCGCYQHIVLRGIDAFLAADSADVPPRCFYCKQLLPCKCHTDRETDAL